MAEENLKKEEAKNTTTPLAGSTTSKPEVKKKTPEERRKEVWAGGKMPAVIAAWDKKHPTTPFTPENIDAAFKEFYGKDIMDETPTPTPCKRCKKLKGDKPENCRCGRPRGYNDEIIPLTYEYLESCNDEEIQRVTQSNEKKGYDMYEYKLQVKLPSIAGLAEFLDVGRQTIYDWKEKYPEFSYVLEKILIKQENNLISKGLSGEYAGPVAKMMMTKHGYKDAVKSEHTGEDGGPIKIEGVEVIVRKTPAAVAPVPEPAK